MKLSPGAERPINAAWYIAGTIILLAGLAFPWLRRNLAAESIRDFDQASADVAEKIGRAATRAGIARVQQDQLSIVQAYGIQSPNESISVSNFAANTIVRLYLPAFGGSDDSYYCYLSGQFPNRFRNETIKFDGAPPMTLETLSESERLYFASWPTSKGLAKLKRFGAKGQVYVGGYAESPKGEAPVLDWVYFDGQPLYEIDRFVEGRWKCSYAIFAESRDKVVAIHGIRNKGEVLRQVVSLSGVRVNR